MSTLSEIEHATKTLTPEDQERLFQWLAGLVHSRVFHVNKAPVHSILDIPPVSLGKVLKQLHSEDDILGEMLED